MPRAKGNYDWSREIFFPRHRVCERYIGLGARVCCSERVVGVESYTLRLIVYDSFSGVCH